MYAFNIVRHSFVLNKYSMLNLPDDIYNWNQNIFRDHSHCTLFGEKSSNFRAILATWHDARFTLGPASYVVTASDLHPVTPGNSALKFTDDTYRLMLVANVQLCAVEIVELKNWVIENHLSLNLRIKSEKIIFMSRGESISNARFCVCCFHQFSVSLSAAVSLSLTTLIICSRPVRKHCVLMYTLRQHCMQIFKQQWSTWCHMLHQLGGNTPLLMTRLSESRIPFRFSSECLC